MWDIRKAVGASVADVVAFEGLFYLPANPGFLDGRDGIVQADIQLFLGADKGIIEQLMFERGIGPPPSPDPFVRIIAEPSFGEAPLPVLLTSIVVDDGTILNYFWDLGDGTMIPFGGPAVSHVYANEGSYTVTLIVTDDTALTGSWSVPVDVGMPGVIMALPEERDIGFVRSDQPTGNFFGDDDVYAGYLGGLDYHGAALFRLPVIPGGSSDVVFDSATLEFTGQEDWAKAPAGGTWSLKLLADGIDSDWRNEGYLGILGAQSLFTLTPPLGNADLASGSANQFSVTSAQLPSLHRRVAAGSISFRMDGPYGVNNLFSWDSGYDRFDEDPAAMRIKPVLLLGYTQGRLAGDVNSDGVVDATDARLVTEVAVGIRTLSQADADAGNVDRNGVLDERDAAAILARAAGVLSF